MKAIVCVKQVPDTSGVVAVKEDGTMDRAAYYSKKALVRSMRQAGK